MDVPKTHKGDFLRDGSQVKVQFLDEPSSQPVAFYTFRVTPKAQNPMMPERVFLSWGDPFVNTGRNFLNDFDVLFDAIGGQFGLRWHGPPNSPLGGPGAGPDTAGIGNLP